MSAALSIACGDARRTVTGSDTEFNIRVQAQPSPALAAVGRALSWPANAVPGARVIATRIVSDAGGPTSADTATTDASGIANFRALALARYTLRVSRTLSASERSLAPELNDVEQLVGESSFDVTSDSGVVHPVTLTGVGKSSLVFSEVFPSFPAEPSGQQYYVGGYLEIHNNSDSTIALAGKLFLEIWDGYVSAPERPNGCSIFSAIERDPLNVWAQRLYRFPSTARDLPAGATVVLATDAIDHRPFGRAGFFDLSQAGAEFPGSSDVDNPLVPNMIELSPRPFEADGHGWRFRGGRQVWALAQDMKTDTLTRWTDAVFGVVLTRIPASALLDLVRYDWDEVNSTPTILPCPSAIATNIDPSDAVLLKVQDTLAIHRRISRTLPNGRVIYQRSRNSAADWIAGKATPGLVP